MGSILESRGKVNLENVDAELGPDNLIGAEPSARDPDVIRYGIGSSSNPALRIGAAHTELGIVKTVEYRIGFHAFECAKQEPVMAFCCQQLTHVLKHCRADIEAHLIRLIAFRSDQVGASLFHLGWIEGKILGIVAHQPDVYRVKCRQVYLSRQIKLVKFRRQPVHTSCVQSRDRRIIQLYQAIALLAPLNRRGIQIDIAIQRSDFSDHVFIVIVGCCQRNLAWLADLHSTPPCPPNSHLSFLDNSISCMGNIPTVPNTASCR